MKISDGEKLILWMLADLHKKLKVDSDIDPDFVIDTLSLDHTWAFSWKYSGIPFEDSASPPVVKEVCNYLDMWDFLEASWDDLTAADKERVKVEADPFGKDVKFPGFDGNNESDHLSATRFLIEKLDRWGRFAGRELNSHMPTLEAYARMYKVFEPLRAKSMGEMLDADDIISILKERVHPSRR